MNEEYQEKSSRGLINLLLIIAIVVGIIAMMWKVGIFGNTAKDVEITTGRRQLGLFAYASCIIIQMRDAKTHQMVASCESEGCGSDETDDILQAIHNGLNTIFAK